ncbi:hypothetical protein TNCV_4868091 [Trichonephila clavipes]|nr:hypothetical protein TNCV_4868091 [Trichonephila clavipes]
MIKAPLKSQSLAPKLDLTWLQLGFVPPATKGCVGVRYVTDYTPLHNEYSMSLVFEYIVTGSRVFSLTCPLGPELKATLFQPNPRSEA